MNKLSILITGGAGYIGSHVNKLLTAQGHNTIILDSLERGNKASLKWGSFFQGDIENHLILDQIAKQHKIDAVIHFAAYTEVGESTQNPILYFNNNISKTIKLLDWCIKNSIQNFVFSSTCAIYGAPKTIPISEDFPKSPINPYGMSKLIIENVLQELSNVYPFKYVALRYFNAAGADLDNEIGESHKPETHLIPVILNTVLDHSSVTVNGNDYPTPDKSCIRDYIHVTDLANAHIKSVEYLMNGGTSNQFNLGTGKGHSIKEVIAMCEKITRLSVKINAGPRRAGDPPVLIANPQKATETLKWGPQISDLETIISSAWAWAKKSHRV